MGQKINIIEKLIELLEVSNKLLNTIYLEHPAPKIKEAIENTIKTNSRGIMIAMDIIADPVIDFTESSPSEIDEFIGNSIAKAVGGKLITSDKKLPENYVIDAVTFWTIYARIEEIDKKLFSPLENANSISKVFTLLQKIDQP